jgi:hypothetical protein
MAVPHFPPGPFCKVCGELTKRRYIINSNVNVNDLPLCDKHYNIELRRLKLKQLKQLEKNKNN